MAERSSPTRSACIESSRTFPERESPHGRGRGCPDASDGNRSSGGEARALPTEPLRSVHHPDPHTDETTVRRRHHTRNPKVPPSRDPIVTHPSPRSLEAPGRSNRSGLRKLLWKTHASKPSTLTATLSIERPFDGGDARERLLGKSGERIGRVACGGLRDRSRIFVANAGHFGDGQHDIRRLVLGSPKLLWSEERRVGLHEEAI